MNGHTHLWQNQAVFNDQNKLILGELRHIADRLAFANDVFSF